MLKGDGEICILDDDVDYNHINNICGKMVDPLTGNVYVFGNVYHPKNYELPYSVYHNFYKKSALTLFIDPLKYPGLVSLVLFEFLNNNNYPQDLKNCILLLYNNV